MRTLIVAAGVAAVLATGTAAQERPPANCEVRTFKDTFDNTTSTSLTLSLIGPAGPIPISTALTAVHRALGRMGITRKKSRSGRPSRTGRS